MSDRFVFHGSKDEVEQVFGVSSKRNDYYEPNYNITPGLLIPVVFKEEGDRSIRNFQWGLIPEDAKAEEEGKQFYETRVESLQDSDWLKECIRHRRCIIPANGFYKWKFTEKKNTPFYIRMLSNDLMGIAGIYSVWEASSGREVYSVSMLTTKANALIQPVDERMPVILRPGNFDIWLQEDKADTSSLVGLLKPYLLTEMAVNRVSEEVNDISNNSPELIQPIPK